MRGFLKMANMNDEDVMNKLAFAWFIKTKLFNSLPIRIRNCKVFNTFSKLVKEFSPFFSFFILSLQTLLQVASLLEALLFDAILNYKT